MKDLDMTHPRTAPPDRRWRASALARLALPTLATATLLACGSGSQPPSAKLQIAVAPLQLDDVEEVTYGIKVTSQLGTVWEKSGMTSTQYGDGKSAISYIGPCDASPGANPHTVELTLENLRAGGADLLDPRDFRNPAPSGSPVRITNVVCVENGDVPVDFNLTVLRSAKQGFFDIAVEFEDIFCSAKLDCPSALLHHGNQRDATAVVGFACASGVRQDTYLYVSDLVLTCDGTPALAPIVIPAMAAMTPGQHGNIGAEIYQWAAYQGDEQLTSNGETLEKCYWNRAIGLDRAALQNRNCTLSGIATATDEPLVADTLTGQGVTYPIIRWSVQVLTDAGDLCDPNPLNVTGSGVQTEYVDASTDPTTLMPLNAFKACGDQAKGPVRCAAGPTVASAPAEVVITPITTTDGTPALSVAAGGAPTTISLTGNLAGYRLGDACCQHACCGAP